MKKILDLISLVIKFLLAGEAFSDGCIFKLCMTQYLLSRRNHVSLHSNDVASLSHLRFVMKRQKNLPDQRAELFPGSVMFYFNKEKKWKQAIWCLSPTHKRAKSHTQKLADFQIHL